MTTVTLPPRPQIVPPLEVEPPTIEECAASLLAASAQVDDLGTFVAGSARIADWTGEAADAYHAALPPLGRRADAMSLALRGVARRVQTHSDRMRELERTRADLVEERGAILDRIDALTRRVADASEEEAPALQTEADTLAQRVKTFQSDLSALATDLDAEESAVVAAFERALTLDRVERHYGGRSDPADGALADRPAPGSTPGAVRRWWASLTGAERDAIVAAAPGTIGNLPGIPAGGRDRANEVALDRDLADWGSADPDDLTENERVWLANARAAAGAREAIADSVDPVTGRPVEAQLYTYDPRAFGGDGAVAISAGDLDRADNVAVVVPGLGTDGQSALYQADRAVTMHESARFLDPRASNATLSWIGYDAPDNTPWDGGWDAGGVVAEGMAERGGERLSDTVDGLREGRPGPPAHLSVVGHSYGSTTAGHALGDHGLPVDDAVVVGSPGLGGGQHHVDDLGLRPGHVWVGANSHDPVADLGDEGWADLGSLGGLGLGDNPAEDDFGATRFEAESADHSANPVADHSKYFDHDTESLTNISHIVNGHYDRVTEADHLHDPWWGGVQDPEGDREARPAQTTRTRP